MADANIVIAGVTLTPNPVTAKSKFLISVEMIPAVFVLVDGDGSFVTDSDGACIEVEG